MLYPKPLGLSLPRTTGIADHMKSTTNEELWPKTLESKRFQGFEGSRSFMKVHTRSSFRPIILPSHKISPLSSQASPRNSKEKEEENSKTKWARVPKRWLPSSHHLAYMEASRKTKITLKPKLWHTPTKGTLGICLSSTIRRIPGDRTSRSLDASLAIPTALLLEP
jgi:hypothetical protein